jgi:hypothetical protein
LTSAAVGYALAVMMPPTVAALIASFLSIALLLFSPSESCRRTAWWASRWPPARPPVAASA